MTNHKKKKQTAPKLESSNRSYSIWYDIVMPIELILYGGLIVFVLSKFFSTDWGTFMGIVFAGCLAYILWRKNMEFLDFWISIPLWVHWLIISVMTGLFIAGKMLLLKLIPPTPVDAQR